MSFPNMIKIELWLNPIKFLFSEQPEEEKSIFLGKYQNFILLPWWRIEVGHIIQCVSCVPSCGPFFPSYRLSSAIILPAAAACRFTRYSIVIIIKNLTPLWPQAADEQIEQTFRLQGKNKTVDEVAYNWPQKEHGHIIISNASACSYLCNWTKRALAEVFCGVLDCHHHGDVIHDHGL